MTTQTIRRAQKDSNHPYKAMRRATFEDSRLSFEARGVLGYILVKPDTWQIQVEDLRKQGGIGRDKTYRILNELIEAGYCVRVELRHKGRIVGYEYLINEEPEEPLPEKPYTEKPLTAEPLTENKDHSNKEIPLKKKCTKEERGSAPAAPPKADTGRAEFYKNQHEQNAVAPAIIQAFIEIKREVEGPGSAKLVNRKREAGPAAALAAASYTPDDVTAAVRIMKTRKFYEGIGITLAHVVQDIGAVLNGPASRINAKDHGQSSERCVSDYEREIARLTTAVLNGDITDEDYERQTAALEAARRVSKLQGTGVLSTG